MTLGQGTQDPLRVIDRRALKPGAFPLGGAIRQAERNLLAFDKELDRLGFVDSEYEIPGRQLIGGQISNLQAYLYQTSRHQKETIVEVTSSPASRGEVASWIAGVSGNRGHFGLSVTSHVRASQRLGVWQMIQAKVTDPAKAIGHVGLIVPPGSESSLSPGGTLMRYMGGVFRVRDWLAIARGHNKARGGLSLAFSLGLHHADPSYLVPITLQRLASMRLAFREYRRAIRGRVQKRAGKKKKR